MYEPAPKAIGQVVINPRREASFYVPGETAAEPVAPVVREKRVEPPIGPIPVTVIFRGVHITRGQTVITRGVAVARRAGKLAARRLCSSGWRAAKH